VRVVDKVGAFVIRRQGKDAQLLLFTHVDYPDAPIQIPGGTIEAGEAPLDAALRELLEESGTSPPLIRKLGVSTLPSSAMPDVILRRHCYLFDGNSLPEQWRHVVTGKGEDESLRFDYRWHSMRRDLRLAGDLGYFLHARAIPELY
jgi:8-oxo-dGTP pyrophosphatase MutT (NUDIX family)